MKYESDGAWKEVSGAGTFGTDADRFNVVEFEPVTTRRLRLEIQLQEGYSTGILEWRIR